MKITSYQIRATLYAITLFGLTIFAFLGSSIEQAQSSPADNLSGFAWSDNIGWISMNCTDTGSCATSPYGVRVASGGALSGYAWSENIGWVSFDASDVVGCPSGTCAPMMNRTTGVVTGWARAIAGGTAGSGGWDGFISLSGANYGIVATGCNWGGYAWGSNVVGWVSFSGSGYGVTGTGDACVVTNPDLVSGPVVVAPVVKVGTSLGMSANVTDNSNIPVTTPFDDNFMYQWNGTGGTWNSFAGNTISRASLGAQVTQSDNANYSVNTYGDLYIQHCVDSTNVINEGVGDTPSSNCSVSNLIKVVQGTLNADKTTLNYGESANLTWNSDNTNSLSCTVDSISGQHIGVGSSGSAPTGALTAQHTIYVFSCNGVPLDSIQIDVDVTPEISASPRVVSVGGNSDLTWNTKGQVGCTISGGTTAIADLSTGGKTVPVTGRSTYTLTCPIGSDSVTVEVFGKGYET